MKRLLIVVLLAALAIPGVVWIQHSHATFTTTAPRNDYTGNGSTATYAYTFRIFAATDLKVSVRDTDGVEETLTYLTDYTVTGVGAFAGGNVVLTAGNLAADYALTIRFGGATQQPIDLRNQGGFFPESVEDALDRLGRYIQKNEDVTSRSLHLQETEAGTDLKTTLPTATDRASKYLAFDASGNPIAASTIESGVTASAYMQTVLDDANAATARETLGAAAGPADSAFRVEGSSDATKKLAFEVDGLTTATTRTITVPDRDLTLGNNLQTVQAATSGTSRDFTGIPAGVRKVHVYLSSVSTTGTSAMCLRIGAGSVDTTGYDMALLESTGAGNSAFAGTTSILLNGASVAAHGYHAQVTFSLVDATNNVWVYSGSVAKPTATITTGYFTGNKTLSGALDRIRLTTVGGSETFDAGQINISYEF